MINEIKVIVKNYLDSIALARLETGIITASGIKITDKLTVPMILVSGNLKRYIQTGDKVRLLRNLGGQDFFILEIIDRSVILENTEIDIEDITTTHQGTISTIDIKKVIK